MLLSNKTSEDSIRSFARQSYSLVYGYKTARDHTIRSFSRCSSIETHSCVIDRHMLFCWNHVVLSCSLINVLSWNIRFLSNFSNIFSSRFDHISYNSILLNLNEVSHSFYWHWSYGTIWHLYFALLIVHSCYIIFSYITMNTLQNRKIVGIHN